MSSLAVPFYKIYVAGKEIDGSLYSCVNSIKIKETSIGSSTCTISLADPEMELIQGSLIVESTPIKVEFGMGSVDKPVYSTTDTSLASSLKSSQERVFEGYVSVIDATFPNTGLPSITLHCMDKTHLMNRKVKSRTWQKMKISDVVNKIFREYGFKVKITDTKVKKDSIEQSNMTDIAFITQLAKEIPDKYFLSYIEGEVAYFVERKYEKPKHQFNYRMSPYNLYAFSPRINKETKKEPRKQEEINLKTLKMEEAKDPTLKDLGSKKVKNSATRK